MDRILDGLTKGEGVEVDAFKVLQTQIGEVLFELEYLLQGVNSRLDAVQCLDSEVSCEVENPLKMSDEELLACVRQMLADLAKDLQRMAKAR